MTPSRPKIACLPNGPYYLLHEEKPSVVPNLVRPDGTACATVHGVALCRCGGSANKPFCDGTHGRNGFTDAKREDRTPDRRVAYRGRSITIFDNRGICAHAGICTDRLKAVFRMGVEPWIDPDGADAAEVMATIDRCPSGALSYEIDGRMGIPAGRDAKVVVTENGPYAVRGGIELLGVAFGDGASQEHYTLCRCGASRNKPFCDGSHWEVGFHDPA